MTIAARTVATHVLGMIVRLVGTIPAMTAMRIAIGTVTLPTTIAIVMIGMKQEATGVVRTAARAAATAMTIATTTIAAMVAIVDTAKSVATIGER